MPGMGYSTVVQQSQIMALGPFEQVNTSRLVGVDQVQSKSVIVGAPSSVAGQQWTQFEAELQGNMLHRFVQLELLDSSFTAMLLTENILGGDWNSPEDDEAWADL